MSDQTNLARENLHGAEGGFQTAINMARSAKSLDAGTLYALLTALQKQAQGLAHLARAAGAMDEKLDAIKKKLGIS